MLIPAKAHTKYISLRTAPSPARVSGIFISGDPRHADNLHIRSDVRPRSVPPKATPYPPKFICTFPHFLCMFWPVHLHPSFAPQEASLLRRRLICNKKGLGASPDPPGDSPRPSWRVAFTPSPRGPSAQTAARSICGPRLCAHARRAAPRRRESSSPAGPAPSAAARASAAARHTPHPSPSPR